jgi:predicted N-acetyltransferase YhbS
MNWPVLNEEEHIMDNLIIRQETPADFKAAEHLTMRAFWNIHGPGCNEHLLVRKIRQSQDYLPNISQVAELDGKVAGAIYYTKAKVVEDKTVHDVVTFGPLAVEPTLQDSGIGKALLEETIHLAREAGYSGIVIIGEPAYYPKRGFVTCDNFGITDEEGKNYDALMCLPLNKELFGSVHGRLIESPVFKECDNSEEIEQLEAEYPAYRKVKIKDGFLMILDKRFGVIEAVNGDTYYVKFWELTIPAKLSKDFNKDSVKPNVGDDVLFLWNKDGKSEITSVCRNMLEK